MTSRARNKSTISIGGGAKTARMSTTGTGDIGPG